MKGTAFHLAKAKCETRSIAQLRTLFFFFARKNNVSALVRKKMCCDLGKTEKKKKKNRPTFHTHQWRSIDELKDRTHSDRDVIVFDNSWQQSTPCLARTVRSNTGLPWIRSFSKSYPNRRYNSWNVGSVHDKVFQRTTQRRMSTCMHRTGLEAGIPAKARTRRVCIPYFRE